MRPVRADDAVALYAKKAEGGERAMGQAVNSRPQPRLRLRAVKKAKSQAHKKAADAAEAATACAI